MRAYFFGNLYLSSIQQGIQALHVVSEMFTEAPLAADLNEWATDHKTVILLNGGYSETLRDIVDLFQHASNQYTWSTFVESMSALDGALTCVGIILPEEIYEAAAEVRKYRYASKQYNDFNIDGVVDGFNHFSKWQVDLINELNKYGLAK